MKSDKTISYIFYLDNAQYWIPCTLNTVPSVDCFSENVDFLYDAITLSGTLG